MVEAGGYDDPWGQAGLRWWDGTAWTGHAHPAQPPTATPGLTGLLGGAERCAVIDVETTGLYSTDRIVEIAVVSLDATGAMVEEFETLVHPRRDVGPTWLHQVTASMVADAPTFDEVAHQVAARLDGAVCVGHNLAFDTRMLTAELTGAGIDIDWGHGLDTLTVTGAKLGVACADHGVPLVGAHSALCDARATAQLLAATAARFPAAGLPARARPVQARQGRIHTRAGTIAVDVPPPYLAGLASTLHTAPDTAPYVDLLDRAVADLRLTPEERTELAGLAADLGLNTRAVAGAHRDFVNALIDAALADGVVTDDEHDQLLRAAALLEVDPEVIGRRTDDLRARSEHLTLAPGMRVCFTGSATDSDGAEIARDTLERTATEKGLTPTGSVTKSGCDLLVAADSTTRSGKAGKARHHGVPIASVDDYLNVTRTGQTIPVSRLATAGVALVCEACGRSWCSQRRATRPLCADCKQSKPARPRRGPVTEKGAVERLTCAECGQEWDRPRARGRKPSRCPTCT